MTEIKLVAIDGVIHMSTAEFWKVQKDIRDNAIEDVIKTLARSEDTMLSDKQYYTLMELKEQKNGNE